MYYQQKCAYTKKISNKQHDNEETIKTGPEEIIFDKPNPWSKIIYLGNHNLYFIKIKIPSLNDYQMWKKIISELNFDPKTGEVIIPSNNENTALAIANLMIMNLLDQITLKDIVDKNLIEISISKANNHNMIKEKIRQQIMNNLYGDSNNNINSNNEIDNNLSVNNNNNNDGNNDDNNIDAYNNEYDLVNNFSFI